MTVFRKALGMPGMLRSIHKVFSKIRDPKTFAKPPSISITDHLMSGLAVFGLKCPSLLDYDTRRLDEAVAQNLRDLYFVNLPPSDTYLRERLDDVNPTSLRPAFKKIFAELQRGKCLEEFEFFEGCYLLSIDGTGEFSSSKVCCEQCCKKEHKDGSVTYYHQMLGACIVHPENRNVIPLCPETIQNGDG